MGKETEVVSREFEPIDFKIVVPTYKRAGRVKVLKVVKDPILCVAESENDIYKENYPDVEVLAHPDSVVGIDHKRQWIYKKFGNVFMLDDDVIACRRMYTFVQKKDATCLTPQETRDLIQWVGNTAAICGCYLFGFTTYPRVEHFNAFKPISLTGRIVGASFGIMKSDKLSFVVAESSGIGGLGEDYIVSGLNAYHYRKCFIDNRFYFDPGPNTASDSGGCAAFRTVEFEKRSFFILKKLFGDAILLKEEAAMSNPKFPYSRKLKIPF